MTEINYDEWMAELEKQRCELLDQKKIKLSDEVMKFIRKCREREKPYSYLEIANLLRRKGINISKWTVQARYVEYREKLNLEDSTKSK